VGAALAQDFVRDAFNQLMERREWSWLMRSSAFYPSVFSNLGLVSCIPNYNVVTGVGTAFDLSWVGSQFRVGANPSNFPTYTIVTVISPTTIVLDKPWIGPVVTNAPYQIFQCYFAVPEDFNYFYSIVNITSNYRLYHNLTQAELDLADPQRVQTGITYAAAFYDYTTTYLGVVEPTMQISGAGPIPVSSTSYGYNYPAPTVFVLTITTGGAPGGALEFSWRQGSGASTTVSVLDNGAIDLINGVQVYFPQDTYVFGNTFIIQCMPTPQSGVPRYELWPRPINTPFVYSYIYACKLPELSDQKPALPDFIARRGDVLLEMALANCARFPGSATMPNPYRDLQLAVQHDARAERMIFDLENKDDDTAIKNLKYQSMPFYPAPWMDGSWLQRHAIYQG
jgi:hypothetical protein